MNCVKNRIPTISHTIGCRVFLEFSPPNMCRDAWRAVTLARRRHPESSFSQSFSKYVIGCVSFTLNMVKISVVQFDVKPFSNTFLCLLIRTWSPILYFDFNGTEFSYAYTECRSIFSLRSSTSQGFILIVLCLVVLYVCTRSSSMSIHLYDPLK